MPNKELGGFTYLTDVVSSSKCLVPFRQKSANGQSYQMKSLGLEMPLTSQLPTEISAALPL